MKTEQYYEYGENWLRASVLGANDGILTTERIY